MNLTPLHFKKIAKIQHAIIDIILRKEITSIEGQETKLYEALLVIAGPFFDFTIGKMKGPE